MSSAATQRFSREFDAALERIAGAQREAILKKIEMLGPHLDSYPHYRMTGREEYRLRVGDYRIVYNFDRALGLLDLIALGHRREVYRD